ncbi:MAG: adenylate/guanylate cyclase domain-containing protein, partial [Gammaproteobacteria bacterium]|nr:adenylate/guanylate cyclase domain-containing protein [Gammaproteobacteria bacterium]
VALLSILLKAAWSALDVAALGLGWLALSLLLLQHLGYLLPALWVLAGIVISYALMLLYRYMIADQQKNHIRNLFSLYLEPAVVDQMLDSGQLPELGGEVREVTVWFSDLANFTNLSEGLSAHELVGLMNNYFSVITDIIEAHGGFVDKYIGDAVVAVFGAPHKDPYHAGRAVAAALMAREILRQMNQSGAFGEREIKTRTGINTGMAVVGNVGSSRRFNYTVMGDAVNLASRLEGANKATGSQIMISDSVAERLPPSIVVRELATIRVKGKSKPTRVYEPLTLGRWVPAHREEYRSKKSRSRRKELEPKQRPDDLQQMQRLAADFSLAQEHYRQRQFNEMLQLLQPYADDPAAQRLMERARQYLQNPPPADWDGVETLLEK